MFKTTNRQMRFASIAFVTLLLTMLLAACGATATNTAAPVVATTAPAAQATTAAPAATTARATTATTAAATTAAVVATTAAPTTAGATSATTAASTGAKISIKTLRFGLIPAENSTKVIDDTKPFADALSKELGVPVELFVGNNYTATIEALASNKIDVALFGPFSYVLAADKYNAEAILLQLGSNGETTYNSFIITNPKTGIKTLADLKGKTFSFVDAASTSGNLIPRYTMTKAGLDPDKDVQGVFAGGHDASLLGVASGKTDAGAVASDIYASLLKDGKFKETDIVIVAKSDPIPNSPIAVRKELSTADKTAIKNAFLAIKDPVALKALNVKGYQEGSDATYNGLRDVAKSLNLDLTKLK